MWLLSKRGWREAQPQWQELGGWVRLVKSIQELAWLNAPIPLQVFATPT